MSKFPLTRRRAALAFTLLLCGAAQAGTILGDAFSSTALRREYRMRIYLPDGYDDKAAARYPVVYLLHGTNGDESWWTGPGGAQATLDALIKRGQLRPSIVVMPGSGNNWYVDSPAEKAESALVGELLPFIEGKYHAEPERSARSIGGFSMGGYGALRLALRHPDRFCAAMLLSPAIYDPLPPSTSSARGDLPFLGAGQFDPARWKALNYPALLPAYRAAPDKVAFWIMSGDHDRHGIALQAAQLNAVLQPLQPKQVELRIVDGDHEAIVWRDGLADALRYADAQCAHPR